MIFVFEKCFIKNQWFLKRINFRLYFIHESNPRLANSTVLLVKVKAKLAKIKKIVAQTGFVKYTQLIT